MLDAAGTSSVASVVSHTRPSGIGSSPAPPLPSTRLYAAAVTASPHPMTSPPPFFTNSASRATNAGAIPSSGSSVRAAAFSR